MDTQIEQLNLSSITKFALAYAGITTVSELKEYNYISLANVLPRNCSLNPIMKELNTYRTFLHTQVHRRKVPELL